MNWEKEFLQLIKSERLVDTKTGKKEKVGVIFIEQVRSFIKQTLINQIKEIRDRHAVPMNSATQIILLRIENRLKEKDNG